MSFQDATFYFFSAILVLSGLGVITARNPVHSALLLVLAFFASAGLWLLLEAEFLAITLVLVYVGAVMVLFLFVVMMLDINLARLREGFWKWFPVGAFLGIVMAAQMAFVMMGDREGAGGAAPPAPRPADYSNTKELGRLIYTEYVYAFELAAVLLLVAIVAAIALTLRRRSGIRSPDVSRQVAVRRGDRVRMVSMPSEKKE
ncbi:NADH-quinone oxidoreductase subunit J [Nitrosovibrio sp. Nv17]|jgi:NADH-quinone oxidoreductase subunit J|uniref:NADH-quinone oxidoreductase subunit J n=1 Tax=Nitrosovibrio sp. Nv17 TaxID=1855339 RepID=UPI0009085DEB|nr:NADH-quinone oxidoreductase subunit J [Nitrosovibrio sp. Nv17]SFW33967.1 NADH dehydrogenase subunit J [Nitrosovibrio sp. Nv17]